MDQAITWTSVDLSSVRYSNINLRWISQKVFLLLITEVSLKVTYLKKTWKSPSCQVKLCNPVLDFIEFYTFCWHHQFQIEIINLTNGVVDNFADWYNDKSIEWINNVKNQFTIIMSSYWFIIHIMEDYVDWF